MLRVVMRYWAPTIAGEVGELLKPQEDNRQWKVQEEVAMRLNGHNFDRRRLIDLLLMKRVYLLLQKWIILASI